MKKQIFKIPVEWAVYETLEIEAETLEEAVKYVEDNLEEIPLGEGDYIDGSYKITGSDENSGSELVKYIKENFNY